MHGHSDSPSSASPSPLPPPPPPSHLRPPLFRYIDVLPPRLFRALQSCEHQPNLDELSYLLPLPPPHSSPPPPPLLIPQCILHLYHTLLSPLLPPPSSPSSPSAPTHLEWWLHSRPPSSSMHLHFDRDEGAWQVSGIARFPLLSSVLYVGGEGGPTMVVREVTDERMTEVKRVEVGDEREGGRVGHLVWPRANSMLVFPGDWLHGVVGVEGEDGEEGGDGTAARRVTLMVNVWAHPLHDPSCVALTAEQCRSPAQQRRFGRPLPSEELLLAEAKPVRVEVEAMQQQQLDQLYHFSLHRHVRDEHSYPALAAAPLPAAAAIRCADT